MKKLFITLALAAATFVGANAQFIIGGHLGLGSNVASYSYDGDKVQDDTDFGFGLGVKAGYAITDRIEIALKIGIDYSWYQNSPKTGASFNNDAFGWYVTPTFRYAFLDSEKFQLGVQADLSFFGDNGRFWSQYFINSNSFGFGLTAKPYVAWKINEHLALDAELNCVGFGFNYITNTEEDPFVAEKNKAGVFNIGENINSNAGNATMNFVTIGLAYKF